MDHSLIIHGSDWGKVMTFSHNFGDSCCGQRYFIREKEHLVLKHSIHNGLLQSYQQILGQKFGCWAPLKSQTATARSYVGDYGMKFP